MHAEVRESIPAFDQAALAAVRQWSFSPVLEGGRAVPAVAKVPVVFDIF